MPLRGILGIFLVFRVPLSGRQNKVFFASSFHNCCSTLWECSMNVSSSNWNQAQLVPEHLTATSLLAAKLQLLLDSSLDTTYGYYANANLNAELAFRVADIAVKYENSDHCLEITKQVITKLNFWNLKDYVLALTGRDDYWISLIGSGSESEKSRYDMDIYRYQKTAAKHSPSKQITWVDSFEAALSYPAGQLAICCKDTELTKPLQQLLEDVDDDLEGFLDCQYDLPGIHSLVRKGLVKSFILPSGRLCVCKRSNPSKLGRLKKDIANAEAIASVLNLSESHDRLRLGKDLLGRAITLGVIRPSAVYRNASTGDAYVFSRHEKGVTLEEVLVNISDKRERHAHLNTCSVILETLYGAGVVWGDMAPRNIIVNQTREHVDYLLLDFEKTTVVGSEIEHSERVEHCRGPMCVEEFGAICSQEEVVSCFQAYFDPDNWDLLNKEDVPFKKLKRELVAIFEGRDQHTYTFGDYNRLEQEVMTVRFPVHNDGARRLPLHASFKVDHYLGTDYDRKTTELMIGARVFGLLPNILAILEWRLQVYEDVCILENLGLLSEQTGSLEKVRADLAAQIDTLYVARQSEEALVSVCRQSKLQSEWYELRSRFVTSCPNGTMLGKKSFLPLRELVVSECERMCHEESNSVAVIGSAGFSNETAGIGSDIDLMVICENRDAGTQFRERLFQQLANFTGLEVEADYPLVVMSSFAQDLRRSTHLFEDFVFSVPIAGSQRLLTAFAKVKEEVLSDPDFQKAAITSYYVVYGGRNETSHLLRKLRAMEAILTIGGVDRLKPQQLMARLRNILLHWKYEKRFSSHYYPSVFLDLVMQGSFEEVIDSLEESVILRTWSKMGCDPSHVGHETALSSKSSTDKLHFIDCALRLKDQGTSALAKQTLWSQIEADDWMADVREIVR